MSKLNCWEVKQCGRQPGGEHATDDGICPVATAQEYHDINCGINGGRACWAIAGTMCGGTRQGTFAAKVGDCMKCDFYNLVREEEGSDYKSTATIMDEVKKNK